MHKFVLSALVFALWAGAAFARPNAVPVILVKGYGPQFAKMNRLQRFLHADGITTHLLHYDQSLPPAQLQKGAMASLAAIIALYPAGTQFDMITHSFGGFVGLYTAMPSAYAGRIRKYISMASVGRGQNYLPFCNRGWCGPTLPKLIPYRNPFVEDFFTRYQAPIARLDKCSLYSFEDNIVHAPADSGKFEGGTNVEIRGLRHMDFIWNEGVYRIMRTACYGVPAPRRGFRHDWRLK
jgi:pimeloyl-ACP methyl ester carboxylesterase